MTVLPVPPKSYDAADQAQMRRIVSAALTSIPPANAPIYTVAMLPRGTKGQRAFVSDASAPTFLGALTGGGAVFCPVFFNGTAWIAG